MKEKIKEIASEIDGFVPKEIYEGDIVSAKVLEVNQKSVIVDLGLKAEGIIPREEFLNDVLPGQEILVFVKKKETSDGHPLVSYRHAQMVKTWEKLYSIFRSNSCLEVKILRKVRDGLIVDLELDTFNLQAFLPVMEINGTYGRWHKFKIGEKINVKIIELNQKKKNIIVSQKKFIDDFLLTLREGEIVNGKITRITSFGAFVSLDSSVLHGVEGLLHISDISWGKVEKIENFIKVGDEIKVKILKIDCKENRISLGLKQLVPCPWEKIETRYKVNSTVRGKVSSVTKFGAFVELEPGVEGLAHVSELCWGSVPKHPEEVVKIGESLDFYVLSVDREKEKISLSLKKTKPNPWEELKIKYPPGTKISGIVTGLTPFGAFVRLPEGIEGLIHISDLSWTKRIHHPQEILKIDEKIETLVLEVIPEKEKIVLGLKQLTSDPYQKYQVGMNLQAKITRINDLGLYLELEPEIEGIVHMSEIPLPKGKNLKEVYKVSSNIHAKIIRVSPENKKIILSIKRYEKEKEWQEMSKYLNSSSGTVTLKEIVEGKE